MPQAPTVALPKRIPLVIAPENRGESPEYDSRLINCFVEREQIGEEQPDFYVYERPGMDEQSRPPAGNATGRGVYNWMGDIYSIFGDRFYVNGVATGISIDTTNGVYQFNQCLGTVPKLQLGNGVKGYNYDAGAGLVQITDPQFPSSFVKGWGYLDGTTYVGTPSAHIQGSDINDPTAWDVLNDILAQIESDRGVALNEQLVYIVFLKQWSTEVFYDAGNAAGSPLGPVQGAKADFGCESSDSVQDIGGTLVWLATTKEAGRKVVTFAGVKAEPVSTPPVERLLKNADTSVIYSWQTSIAGHKFYVLTLKNENLTLVYDLKEKMWSQWTDTNGNYVPIVSSTYTSDHRSLLQHESNGRLYYSDMSYATDDGDLIQVDIYTPPFDGGTKRGKQLEILKLVADQQVGSVIGVRVNDNDYDPKGWSTFRYFDMSQKDPWLDSWGTFTRRAHNLRHRLPVRMPRIQAVEPQIDICTL